MSSRPFCRCSSASGTRSEPTAPGLAKGTLTADAVVVNVRGRYPLPRSGFQPGCGHAPITELSSASISA
jgi:hypothetical protein